MKKEASLLKPLSPYFSRLFSSLGPRAFTLRGKGATTPSSSTATGKSGTSGWKRPSRCLQLAFLALGISAYLSLQVEPISEDPEVSKLIAKGWKWQDTNPCENLEPGKFYEIDSEWGATEFYVAGQEKFLSPPPHQWPEPPAICRPISQPSFIQEIL